MATTPQAVTPMAVTPEATTPQAGGSVNEQQNIIQINTEVLDPNEANTMRENSIVPENMLLIEPEKTNDTENTNVETNDSSQHDNSVISIERNEEKNEPVSQPTKSVSFNNITIKKIE